MYWILIGFIMGFFGVGLPTLRTINTINGKYINVFFISLFSSVNLFAFTHFVVANNYYFMGGNMFGAAISVTLLAYIQNQKKCKK